MLAPSGVPPMTPALLLGMIRDSGQWTVTLQGGWTAQEYPATVIDKKVRRWGLGEGGQVEGEGRWRGREGEGEGG